MSRLTRCSYLPLLLAGVVLVQGGDLGAPAGAQGKPEPAAPPRPGGWISYAPEQVGLRDALVAEQAERNVSEANFGGITALQVRSKANGKTGTSCRTFLWFDPTRLAPAGARLEKVVLQLYNLGKAGQPGFATGEVTVLAYRVLAPWQEGQGKTLPAPQPYPQARDAISWANQPTYNPVPWAEATLKPVKAEADKGYFVNWDITGLTKAWLAGTYRNHGLVLIGASEDEYTYLHAFASKEYPHGAVVQPRIWAKISRPATAAEVRAAYSVYLLSYNRLTELVNEGKGDTPEGREAYEKYLRAKRAYEAVRKK